MKRPFAQHKVSWCSLRVAVLGLLLAHPATGNSQTVESRVKAAFLYNFAKYVAWPSSAFPSSSAPLVIGVVGDGPMATALQSIVDGKTVGGRRLVVRRLRWTDELATCNELFVPAGEMAGAAHLELLHDRPVLIVGECPGFARKHGVINFVVESNRVRFEINDSIASQSGLSISSKLLSLGRPPS